MIQIRNVYGKVLYTADNAQDVKSALVKAVGQGAWRLRPLITVGRGLWP